MSVHNFPDKGVLPPAPPGGSEPPMALLERVANLEKSVIDLRIDILTIKQHLDSELPQMATKADLFEIRTDMHKEFNVQTWKVMGLMVTLVLGVFGLMRAFPPKIEVPPIQIQYAPQQSIPSSLSQPASTQNQVNKAK